MLARLVPLAPALLALPLAVCGDDEAFPPVAAPSIDAAVDGDAPPVPVPKAAAVSGDINVTGVFTTFDVESKVATPNALAAVAGGDPYLRRYGNELFIINLDRGENITIVGTS